MVLKTVNASACGVELDHPAESKGKHYQRAVLKEFLPALIGSEMTRQIVGGDRRFYQPQVAFIPLEFADAAYRYGHGQIRHRYLLQNGAEAVPVFRNLLGFQPVAPRHRVD